MPRHVLGLFVVALLATSAARAADKREESKLTVTGWGNERCATINTNTVAHAGATDWVMGFLSGVNWEDSKNRNRGAETTNAGIAQWLDGYCQSHPEDYVMQAAMTLTLSFEKKTTEKKPAKGK